MAAILWYVPVMNTNSPKDIINTFLIHTKMGIPSGRVDLQTSSMRGGNTSAKAVLLTAPTKEMNRPSFGIVSASTTKTYKKLY